MKKITDSRVFFYGLGKLLLIFGIAFLILWRQDSFRELLTGSQCVFRRATGLYCPGCGGTRAVEALMGLRLIKSFAYHPAVPYFFLLYVIFMTRMFLSIHSDNPLLEKLGAKKIRVSEKRIETAVLIGGGIILAQWFLKNTLLLVFHIKWIT